MADEGIEFKRLRDVDGAYCRAYCMKLDEKELFFKRSLVEENITGLGDLREINFYKNIERIGIIPDNITFPKKTLYTLPDEKKDGTKEKIFRCLSPIAKKEKQHDNLINFFFEKAEGDLFDLFISRRITLPLSEIYNLMNQLIGSINFINVSGFMHMDIGVNNTLLINSKGIINKYAICDFGMALPRGIYPVISPNNTDKILYYTYSFRAPEILTHGTFDITTDIFAIGMILFYLMIPGLYDSIDEKAPHSDFHKKIYGTSDLKSVTVDKILEHFSLPNSGYNRVIASMILPYDRPDSYELTNLLNIDCPIKPLPVPEVKPFRTFEKKQVLKILNRLKALDPRIAANTLSLFYRSPQKNRKNLMISAYLSYKFFMIFEQIETFGQFQKIYFDNVDMDQNGYIKEEKKFLQAVKFNIAERLTVNDRATLSPTVYISKMIELIR